MVDAEFEDAKLFSITGYFNALLKIIENGYGAVPAQPQIPPLGNPALTQEIQNKYKQDRVLSKQATYFALFALLDFIIQVPLAN
jgi:hypothetical protein